MQVLRGAGEELEETALDSLTAVVWKSPSTTHSPAAQSGGSWQAAESTAETCRSNEAALTSTYRATSWALAPCSVHKSG